MLLKSKGDEMMGFSKKSAAVGTITGGGLLAINIIWQGYLDLTLGGDSFLHDVTHVAYYLNIP